MSVPNLELLCEITATMEPTPIGTGPDGLRVEFPFRGVATGPHWEGERPVRGVDHGRVRPDGSVVLDITGVIGEGRRSVFYRASGVALPGTAQGEAFPQELFTFETGDAELAFLNTAVAVGFGHAHGASLTLTVHLVSAG